MERGATVNLEAVSQFHDLRAHRAQIVGDRGDAVGFLHPQFLGVPDDGRAVGEGAGDSENRQFIDQLRDFLALNDGAFEMRACDLENAARLHLFDVLDRFAHLRPHSHEYAEQAGASLVQTNIPTRTMSAGLSGRGHQPEGGGRNVARDAEVARLRHLIAENAHAAFVLMSGGQENN